MSRAISLAVAVILTLVIILLAGGAVEVENHVGLLGGLGLHDEIAKAIADTGTFAVAAVLICQMWRWKWQS